MSSGVVWQVQSENGTRIFYDTKNKIKVTGIVATNKTFSEAQNSCPAGYHVPTAEIKNWTKSLTDPNNQTGEFATLNADGIRNVILDMQKHRFWTSSPFAYDFAFVFYGGDGGVYSGYRDFSNGAVLCVAQR